MNSYSSSTTQPFLNTAPRRSNRTGVVHLCADLNYGDPARETVTLAVLTQRLGWRALIASSGGALVIEAERAAVKHIRMPLDQRGMFSSWRNRVHLETLVQRERPALVHAHGIETVEVGCRLSRLHRLPLVVDLTQPLPDTPATHRLMTLVAQSSCTVRVPTETMAQHLTGTFRINPALVARVAPGVDLQSYNPAAISAERLHNLSRLWRLPEQGIVVLVPMPLEPGMGHALFLQAMAKIKEEKLYAIMVGSDRHARGMREEIEGSVTRLELNGKVIVPESCPDWPAAFWLANVVVAPNSVVRGQNMEMLGAQALGRPVIATTVGANEELAVKGETAWMIPPDDPVLLAKALRDAARLGTDARVNLAENTRTFVEDHFPQADWFNGMMEVYEGLMFPSVRGTAAHDATKVA
ncbi:MAG: glycosyltransferase [Alphaproteobacteria bacterium]|nr:glycosyltransferase [Alphaproteobacteria bacterium]